MGASASASSWPPLQRRSRSSSELERIRHTPERKRSRLAQIAQSTRHFAKLSFKRRGASHREEVRVFRSLISSWSAGEMALLAKEWSTAAALQELHEEADNARKIPPCLGFELWNSSTQDTTLVYEGEEFAVHSRLLCVRSGLISRLRTASCARIELFAPVLEAPSIDVFREFLLFLYTEQWMRDEHMLNSLCDWFESRRSLSEDLALVAQFASSEGDLELVFAPPATSSKRLSVCRVRTDSSILGARSSLLKRMVDRRRADGNSSPMELQLDEGLLSRAFAPALLHFIYTDKLDLTTIEECSGVPSWSSLSEARAIVAGRVGTARSPLHAAIHLFHIAKFLDIPRLASLCEDALVKEGVEMMGGDFESLAALLRWARAPGGSAYVARKTRAAIVRQFSRFVDSPALFHLEAEALDECLDSDALQASEVDVLEAVIRWSEHELVRRMEEREPNLVAETTHSVSRRGVRRGELSGGELREIAAPLLKKVRVRYVLPPFHQSLTNAYKRGLLEQEPLQDLICPSTSELHPELHWFRPGDDTPGPRLYEPYYLVRFYHLERRWKQATKAALKWRSEGGESKSSIASLEVPSPRDAAGTKKLSEEVVVENLLPEIIPEEEFYEIRLAVLLAIDEKAPSLGSSLRRFQRKKAVQLISQRVLRERGVDEESVGVRLKETPVETPAQRGEIATSQALSKATSAPALTWPDLMTLKRRPSQSSVVSDYGHFNIPNQLSDFR